jgi:hypothetical protein
LDASQIRGAVTLDLCFGGLLQPEL